MTTRKLIRLPVLIASIAAVGLIYCGSETDPDEQGNDQPPPAKADAGTNNNDKPDGGNNNTKPDAGSTKPELPEMQNVTINAIRSSPSTYVDLSTRKSKAIVNVKDAVIVSSYKHSGGEYSLYMEQGSGAELAGMLLYYSPGKDQTAPAVGSKVDVRGCVNEYWSVLQIQYCADSANTQVTVSNVREGSVPALPESSKIAVAELAGDKNTHDGKIGLRVQATGDLTVANAQADECKGTGSAANQFFCIKMSDGVYLKTAFTYKCDAALLAGPYTNLVGAWDWYHSGDNKFRAIVPLSCDALQAAKAE